MVLSFGLKRLRAMNADDIFVPYSEYVPQKSRKHWETYVPYSKYGPQKSRK